MQAAVGDRIVVLAPHTDQASREGEVLEVHDQAGNPPWRVRWSSDGHESLFFPGPDTRVRHAAEQQQG